LPGDSKSPVQLIHNAVTMRYATINNRKHDQLKPTPVTS